MSSPTPSNNPTTPPQASQEPRSNDKTGAAATTTTTTAADTRTSSPAPTRKRTRATAEQLAVLEDTFAVNVSPNGKLRKQLSERLQMSERSIQIWFQNRRAKVKHMQKRAQMQMQQASLRAQMYPYPQYNPMMPPPPPPPTASSGHHHHHPYYYGPRVPLPPRAQSAEASFADHHSPYAPINAFPMHPHQQQQQQQQQQQPTLPPGDAWQQQPPPPPPTAMADPPQYAAQSAAAAAAAGNIPTLVPVPNAGPTAMLATTEPSSSPAPVSDGSFWGASPEHAVDPALAVRALSDPPMVTTIDPASIMMTPPNASDRAGGNAAAHLNATTLTIGTWQRLKLRANDLVCAYDGERRVFSWQIADNGCRFKIDMTLDAVSSIEYIANDVLADVHFDISEPPLFYMEQKTSGDDGSNDGDDGGNDDGWVQCSDFTEGKQASRFFRHSLKGVAHHLKQELESLTEKHPETQRLVRYASVNQQQQQEEHDFWLAAAIAAAAAGGSTTSNSSSTDASSASPSPSPVSSSHHYAPASTLYWTPPPSNLMLPATATVAPSLLLG